MFSMGDMNDMGGVGARTVTGADCLRVPATGLEWHALRYHAGVQVNPDRSSLPSAKPAAACRLVNTERVTIEHFDGWSAILSGFVQFNPDRRDQRALLFKQYVDIGTEIVAATLQA